MRCVVWSLLHRLVASEWCVERLLFSCHCYCCCYCCCCCYCHFPFHFTSPRSPLLCVTAELSRVVVVVSSLVGCRYPSASLHSSCVVLCCSCVAVVALQPYHHTTHIHHTHITHITPPQQAFKPRRMHRIPFRTAKLNVVGVTEYYGG